jgi:hypothetical protein
VYSKHNPRDTVVGCSVEGHASLLVIQVEGVLVVVERDVAVIFGLHGAFHFSRQVLVHSQESARHVVTKLLAAPHESNYSEEDRSQFSKVERVAARVVRVENCSGKYNTSTSVEPLHHLMTRNLGAVFIESRVKLQISSVPLDVLPKHGLEHKVILFVPVKEATRVKVAVNVSSIS